tara:strand:- start:75 stop:572 length:498 start_codon:yes stop_codon:yes gene_type:complete
MQTSYKSLIFIMATLPILSFPACDNPPEETKNELSGKEKYLNKKLQEQRDTLKQFSDNVSSDMTLKVVTFKESGETRKLTNEEEGFFAKISPMLCDGENNQGALKKELFDMGFGNIELTGTMYDKDGNSRTIDIVTLDSEKMSLMCQASLSSIDGVEINHSTSLK